MLHLELERAQPLRQTEGLMRSIVRFMQLDLAIPDHTTLSRRSKGVLLRKKQSPQEAGGHRVIIVDSTGCGA